MIYALTLVFSMYIMFMIFFWDILQGKTLFFDKRDIIMLMIETFIFIGIVFKFFTHTQKKLSNRLILFILFISLLLSLVLQNEIVFQKTSDMNKKVFDNPLYEKYIGIAHKYNLDLSFTKKVWEQRGPRNYKINDIFHQEKKSIDILFIGDSAIAWGLIPQVIEQMTHKKVAVYAYEANVLTDTTTWLYNKLAHYYLKENGMVIFSFEDRNKARSPKMVSISVKEFNEIMAWQNLDFQKYATKINKNFYDKYLSYKAFHKKYNQISENLKETYGLGLQSPTLYSSYVEEKINPVLHQAKMANENEKTKFLRWDMRSSTQYNPQFKDLAFHNENMSTKAYINENIRENVKSAAKIYGKHKIYMVNLFNNKESYQLTREIYQRYYEKLGFELCDLGVFLKDNTGFIMQEDGTHLNARTHMGNEGGLMKSILIGEWLKAYFAKQTE